MSSAILYVAIVVIWAGVLIPRWLRRDSSDTAAAAAERAEAEAAAALEFAAGSAAGSAGGSAGGDSVDSGVEEAAARVPGPAIRRRREAPRSVPSEPVADESVASDPVASDPLAGDPGHRRVLAARRRLLIMLLALSVASAVLAGTRMAAWWVIVPPSVMLLGYLLLLREAAKADTERREMARYRMDREAAERRSAPVAHVAPVVAGPVAAGAPLAPVAPVAPVAKIIAFLPPPEEQIYDQYTDAKRRAVGDLRIPAPVGCHFSRAAQHPGSHTHHLTRLGRAGQRRRCHNDAHLTTWVPQRRCCLRGRGRFGVAARRGGCGRGGWRGYWERTLRVCGPRKEMLGWKVRCWPGTRRRRG